MPPDSSKYTDERLDGQEFVRDAHTLTETHTGTYAHTHTGYISWWAHFTKAHRTHTGALTHTQHRFSHTDINAYSYSPIHRSTTWATGVDQPEQHRHTHAQAPTKDMREHGQHRPAHARHTHTCAHTRLHTYTYSPELKQQLPRPCEFPGQLPFLIHPGLQPWPSSSSAHPTGHTNSFPLPLPGTTSQALPASATSSASIFCPPQADQQDQSVPSEQHGYEMWGMWTRVLHPSRGHERTQGGDYLPALYLPKHWH